MEDDMLETAPQRNCSWLKGNLTWYKHQDFWNVKVLHEGRILAQETFKAEPSDVILCSCPKTGTTWLKALAFAIVTRNQFDESTSPLLTTLVHECIPFLDQKNIDKAQDNHKIANVPLLATHLPYHALPESVMDSDCKIVYIYRNTKDVIVSYYQFMREAYKLSMEDAPFEEAFNEFYEGISLYGPYWDHILGFWKASQERPGRILFLKYEDLKKDPTSNVKKLAEFIGYPFSVEEENSGAVDKVIELCSFKNMKNLEVNKSGKHREVLENRSYFRKAEDGDWKNHFTDEMKEKIDKLMDEKLGTTGLVLK